ncbi:MAG TPA: branched-chain amino acid ABC transporter permease [Candidatus Acetothermia bacterium]|nr:branched-chain amino acid ABC transporter permease [Candidatus Acetothermia bacterium]
MLASILIQGLILTGTYSMLAVGFSLVFGVGRVLNLAHTAFFMLGSYGIFFFLGLGAGMPIAILASTVTVVVVGLLLYRLFIDPVREMEATVLIMALAIAVLLQEGLRLLSGGAASLPVPPVFPGFIRILGVRVRNQEIAVLALAVISLTSIWLLLTRTRLGLAIRAAAQDREVANLMGIHVRRITTLVMGLGLVLAALAGAAVAPIRTVEPHMWMHPLVIVLAAVVLGGLGSLKGSLIGAAILAFAEVTVRITIPGGGFLRTAVALAIMLAVFLLRPEGLFGSGVAEEG